MLYSYTCNTFLILPNDSTPLWVPDSGFRVSIPISSTFCLSLFLACMSQ